MTLDILSNRDVFNYIQPEILPEVCAVVCTVCEPALVARKARTVGSDTKDIIWGWFI